MKLDKLLEKVDFRLLKGDTEVEINDICYDSRKITKGDLFICIPGTRSDGHDYIHDAVSAEAAAIIVQNERAAACVPDGVPVLYVESARKTLASLSQAFFDTEETSLIKIAITGTKGKTTITHMIRNILMKAGKKVGTIGTTGVFYGDKHYDLNNTTPESYELHKIISQMQDAGCEYLIMEASSQSAKMQRVSGMKFDYGIFTNISPDHIGPGEHDSFEEYMACKKEILSMCDTVIMSQDDPYFEEMSDNVKCMSLTRQPSYVEPCLVDGSPAMSFVLGDKTFRVSMPGDFSVDNAIFALELCRSLLIDDSAISAGLEDIHVSGRMEPVYVSDDLTVIIDFAHNGSSAASVLSILREYCRGRLITVFGCGGNRSRERRFGMGESAGKLADICIITTDNPRWEKLADINKDIIDSINKVGGRYVEVNDREEAIKYAVEISEPGDIVVTLGKGHELYMEIDGIKHFYSEHEAIMRAVSEKN